VRNSIQEGFDSICYNEEKMDIMVSEMGRRIRDEALKQNINMQELAKLSGVDVSSIYRMRDGKALGLKNFLKLIWALDIPADKVIPFDEHYRPKSNGERFDELTCGLNVRTVNLIFDIVTDFLKYNKSGEIVKRDEYEKGNYEPDAKDESIFRAVKKLEELGYNDEAACDVVQCSVRNYRLYKLNQNKN
jgi:transcriptional regulator with XRE-family HTH domain